MSPCRWPRIPPFRRRRLRNSPPLAAAFVPGTTTEIHPQAEAFVLEAAPIIPIYFNTHVYFLHPAVKGWQPTPTDHSDFRYVWLEAPK